jgi:hypothetical protein
MPWAKLDDQFPDHPKIEAAGPAAAWLFVASICYSGRYLTDGFIPAGRVARLTALPNPEACAARLVEAGLWEPVENGYYIHDFLEYNPSREMVLRRTQTEGNRDYWDRIRAYIAPIIHERNDFKCVYCGSSFDLTVDHIVPLAFDGKHDLDNLTTACRACNSSKGASSLTEWSRRNQGTK